MAGENKGATEHQQIACHHNRIFCDAEQIKTWNGYQHRNQNLYRNLLLDYYSAKRYNNYIQRGYESRFSGVCTAVYSPLLKEGRRKERRSAEHTAENQVFLFSLSHDRFRSLISEQKYNGYKRRTCYEWPCGNKRKRSYISRTAFLRHKSHAPYESGKHKKCGVKYFLEIHRCSS